MSLVTPELVHPVELTLVSLDGAVDQSRARLYEQWLSEQERNQMDRFHFEKDRMRYLVTRGALRQVLSFHAPILPSDWRFGANAWGKPFVNNSEWQDELSFNVSHTDRLILIGVTRISKLGVDVECLAREISVDLAEGIFSPEEVIELRMQPNEEQQQRFLDIWTLKEAYVKARGLGLSIPLNAFHFRLPEDGSIEATFHPSLCDRLTCWHFFHLDLGDDHIGAVCMQAQRGVPSISVTRLLPNGTRVLMDAAIRRASRGNAPRKPALGEVEFSR